VDSPPSSASSGAPSRLSRSSRYRRFTGLWWVVATDFLASAAISLAMVVLVLRIYAESSESSWLIVAVFLAVVVPRILLEPVTGRVATRVDPIVVVGCSDLAVAGLMTMLALVSGAWIVIAVLAVAGAIWAMAIPAGLALVPRIAAGATTRANGWIHASSFAGTALGALAAAVFSPAHGERMALLTTALITIGTGSSYLVLGRHFQRRAAGATQEAGAGAVAPGIGAPGQSEGETEARCAAEAHLRFAGRLQLLFGIAEVRGAVLGAAAMILLVHTVAVAEVFLPERVLHAGAIGYSAMITVWTGGSVIGTVLAGRLRSAHLVGATLWSIVGTGAALALVALPGNLDGVLGIYLLAGIANGVEVVGVRSVLHDRVPKAVHGSVFATYGALSAAGVVLGTALAGAAQSLLGARLTFAVAGLASLAVGAGLLLVLSGRRSSH